MTRKVRTDETLRIAMVAACTFPSPRGSQVLIRELAQRLADRVHEVHLVTYPHGETLAPLSGMFVHRIRSPRFVGFSTRLGWRKVVLDFYLGLMLYRVVRREQIQVIHAHNYEGPLLGYVVRWFTGVPVVYHSHNALSDELAYYFKPGWRQTIARCIGRLLDRQIPRRANFSIALTPELEGFLRAHGVKAGRLAIVPPSTTITAVPEIAVLGKRDPFPRGRFVVMYTGNLDPYQDLEVLYRGFAQFQAAIPRALLVLVTHERRWVERSGQSLAALVRTGSARVLVVPAFSVVRRLIGRADVLVCPRSSWSGYPIKLINYLATGRPVVAANGSAKGVIDGETGLIFANGNAEGLAAALHRLSNDAALGDRLGRSARAVVRQ